MAHATVFQNPYQAQESWSAQGAIITWAKMSSSDIAIEIETDLYKTSFTNTYPLLATQVSLNFNRSLSKMYPVTPDANGNRKQITLAGAPKGQLTVHSLLSPTGNKTLASFLNAVAKPCKKDTEQVLMTIQPFGGDCQLTDAKGNVVAALNLGFVELDRLDFQIQGGEVATVNLPLTFSFSALDFEV